MLIKKNSFFKFFLKNFIFLTIGIFTPLTFAVSLHAAEKIYFVYDPIEDSLNISSLEVFVKDGTINEDIAFYMNIAKVNEQEKILFREALTKKIDVDPVVLSRLLKTDEGERLLNFFGDIINIQGGRNGKFALRGAIITAALDSEGLTLLNFLRQLSVDVEIDVKKAIAFAQDIDIIVNGTEQFVEEVAQLSAQEAQKSAKIDFASLPDLRQPGRFAIEEKTMLPDVQLPSPELLSEYSKAMMLAFYEVYIAKNSDYLPYLNPSYAAYLSEGEEFKTFMITEASTEELVEAIDKFKEENQLSTTDQVD